MKILIAEDDLASRQVITRFMTTYGECDVTVNGIEAIEAYVVALNSGKPYDLICLDVMMPKVDGIKALTTIRQLEHVRGIKEERRVKIIVTTALGETDYVMSGIETGMEAYVNKPIAMSGMEDAMKKLGLI